MLMACNCRVYFDAVVEFVARGGFSFDWTLH
jgi:hypothetical protein